MQNTVWNDPCRSWYKSGSVDGKVTALWPGSTLHYLEALGEGPRWEDYKVRYSGNRFAWLGNGFSRTEVDDTADWAWYIGEEDRGQWLSRGKRLRVKNRSGTIDRSGGGGGGMDFAGGKKKKKGSNL